MVRVSAEPNASRQKGQRMMGMSGVLPVARLEGADVSDVCQAQVVPVIGGEFVRDHASIISPPTPCVKAIGDIGDLASASVSAEQACAGMLAFLLLGSRLRIAPAEVVED